MLFAKSSLNQIEVIQECLNKICEAFGAKISVPKTKLFFSKNTPPRVRIGISASCGFKEVAKLGRYLRVLLFSRRITKAAYSFVTNNIRKCLSGWKTQNLSLAGQITLVNSILTTIPNYSM